MLKPESSTVSTYGPGRTLTNVKKPERLLTRSARTFVAWLTRVTVAPGTTAPVESVTVPFTPPMEV